MEKEKMVLKVKTPNGKIVSDRSFLFSRQQGMPNIKFIKVNNKLEYDYRAVTNNIAVVARIDEFGYVEFNGTKQSIIQEINQHTTYTPTSFGQELKFDPKPNNKDIFFYYVHEFVIGKTYRFYPNGYWHSLFKMLWETFKRTSGIKDDVGTSAGSYLGAKTRNFLFNVHDYKK